MCEKMKRKEEKRKEKEKTNNNQKIRVIYCNIHCCIL
jgi:hypothetical protein